jgi:outer membrane protein assembly factor BamA
MEDEPFLPVGAENALEKIRTLYWPLGYNNMRSDYSLVLDRGVGVVDVTFTITEGPQSIVGPIQVRGSSVSREDRVATAGAAAWRTARPLGARQVAPQPL